MVIAQNQDPYIFSGKYCDTLWERKRFLNDQKGFIIFFYFVSFFLLCFFLMGGHCWRDRDVKWAMAVYWGVGVCLRVCVWECVFACPRLRVCVCACFGVPSVESCRGGPLWGSCEKSFYRSTSRREVRISQRLWAGTRLSRKGRGLQTMDLISFPQSLFLSPFLSSLSLSDSWDTCTCRLD